jgi:hypothetical protein
MPLHKNEVGDVLYVWTQTEGQQSTGVVEVVISAHGEKRPASMNGMRSTQDCMLVFYGPHGMILNALPLEQTLSGRAVPFEYVRSNNSQDYWLTKYTNSGEEMKHSPKGETYAELGRMDEFFSKQAKEQTANVNDARSLKATLALENQRWPGHAQRNLVDSEWQRERYKTLSKDVVTIRSRSLHDKGIHLSVLLKALRDHGYKYKYIHCCFCRGANGSQNQSLYMPEGSF